MKRTGRWLAIALMVLAGTAAAGASGTLAAQQNETSEAFRSAQVGHTPSEREVDIMGHLANSRSIEIPWFNQSYVKVVTLPSIPPIRIGNMELDLSPTKHSFFIVVAALIVGLVFILTARSVQRAHDRGEPPRGFANAMEATALYLRQEVILPNVGPHGEGYVPYLLTTFFFILACNLLGLVPYMATPTGNIAVTGALALLAFIIIEISGMRSLGLKGYLGTIFFLPPGLPAVMKPVILVIMTPIEIIGKLAKPFALAVRLFANMTAGHALVLALIGLTFTFQSYIVGGAASVMATSIMVLEVFVAFLQAFVFTLLTAVFIGLMREAH